MLQGNNTEEVITHWTLEHINILFESCRKLVLYLNIFVYVGGIRRSPENKFIENQFFETTNTSTTFFFDRAFLQNIFLFLWCNNGD